MSLNYSLYTNEELTNIPEPKNNQNSLFCTIVIRVDNI